MDIESSFRRMQDDAGWRLAPLQPRAHAMQSDVASAAAAPSRRRWFVVGIAGVAMVAVAALVVVGIVSWRGGSAQPIVSPSSSSPAQVETPPTADPTESAIALPALPPTVFGGSCASLFTTEQADELLRTAGATPALTESGLSDVERVAALAQGGLACSWGQPLVAGAFGYWGTPGMSVLVVPAAAVTTFEESTNCEASPGADITQCRIGVISGGYALEASIEIESADVDASAIRAAVEAALGRAADRFGAPQPWAPARDAWTGDLDCAAIAEDSGVKSALGAVGAMTGAPATGSGGSTPYLENAVPEIGCRLDWNDTHSISADAYVYPGAASQLERFAGASHWTRVADVDGHEAYTGSVALETVGERVWIADGSDLVSVALEDFDPHDSDLTSHAAATAVLAAIDAQR